MAPKIKQELPFRSKLEMIDDISQVLQYLHQGDRMKADLLLDDLKTRAIYFDEEIQQDVLIFADRVAFQYDYDPWHKVTVDVVKAADHLLETLGFSTDSFPKASLLIS